MTDSPDKKAKKEPRSAGTGQIIDRSEKKPNGKSKGDKWLLRIFLGRDSEGKRHYHSEMFNGRKKDAEEKLRDLLRRHQLNEPLRESGLTFSQFLDQWLAAVKLRARERTYRHYETMIDYYVRGPLGGRRLVDISSHDITAVYTNLKECRKAARTIRYVHTLLSNVFKLAMRREMVRKNPMLAVDPPAIERREVSALTVEEIHAILGAAGDDRALFTIAFYTGARPCEYLALKWADVDWQAKTITIQRSIVWRKTGDWYFTEPKTASSRRTVPLSDAVLSLLGDHRTRQLKGRMLVASSWRNKDLIFCNEIGEAREINAVRHAFKGLLKSAKLPETIRLYDARHSCATALIAAGINSKVVSERLGHSSVKITLDTYTHVSQGLQKQASDELDKALLG
jgi:integrase